MNSAKKKIFTAIVFIPGIILLGTLFVKASGEPIVNNITIVDEDTGESATTVNFVNAVDPASPLFITKSPNKTTVDVGENISFTTVIKNNSTDGKTLGNIILVDDFPETLLRSKNFSASPGITCQGDASEIRCNVASLAPGNSVSVIAEFTAISPGTATVIASATDKDKNTNSVATNVIIGDTGNPFVISKVADKESIEAGEEVNYTITVTNRSSQPLTKVNILDYFPENILEIQNVTPEGITCENTDSKISCTIDRFDPGATFTIRTRYKSLIAGTAINTVTAIDEKRNTRSTSKNVVVVDPGNIFLVSKQPNKQAIEVGEEVEYSISITNRTNAQIINDVNIVDDFPEAELTFVNMESSPGLVCLADVSEIRCNIQEMKPGEAYTMKTRYVGAKAGTALSTLTVSSEATETGSVGSSIRVVEPIIRSLRLGSDCEGKNILLNQQCVFTAIASYKFAEEKDVSTKTNFFNFQNIGTLVGNVFTATKAGTANVTAVFESINSNPITIKVISDISSGTDPNGNIITHFPVRTGGGSDTIHFGDPISIGTSPTVFDLVAKNNRIVFSGLGGSGSFHWFLENRSLGALRSFETNALCPNTALGSTCRNTKSVVFESGNTKGTVLLQASDDSNNILNITIHILSPSVNAIEILDTDGKKITGAIDLPRQNTVSLLANKIYADGSIEANAEDELIWEFSHNGGQWVTNSEAGNISRGILEPIQTGTFSVRAKTSESVALPGKDALTQKSVEIISDAVTVQIGDAIPFIDSLRTAGNAGFAKGTSDILFARLRHFDTTGSIGDIELSLIRGEFTDPKTIPSSAQNFSIELIPEKIVFENGTEKEVLLKIPFSIPLLDDIKRGRHTLRLVVNNSNGFLGRNIAEGLLPVYIGQPIQGDANRDEKMNLVDAVLMMRIISGTQKADALQFLALDSDVQNGITLSDFLTLFRVLLRNFLQ